VRRERKSEGTRGKKEVEEERRKRNLRKKSE
jgi:hypothetical protein